jgi:mannose-6-phosphate isomerase-like protein (cupin superfamily)
MSRVVIVPRIEARSSASFTVADLGPFDRLRGYELKVPQLDQAVRGKVFLKALLGLTGVEVSLTTLPPGAAIPYLHRHRTHEELYVFTVGHGQMQVDGETFEVAEGTVVRVAPAGARSIRAAPGVELRYACIQAREGSLEDEGADDGELVRRPVRWPGVASPEEAAR